MSSISVPPIGDAAKRIGAHFTPLRVDAQDSPNLTVKIEKGSFYTALGEFKEYFGGNSPTLSAPTADAKWVVIALNENALIEVFNGTSSTSPQLPTIPEDVLPLAAVFLSDTTTEITSDTVFDIRPLWQIRPENIPNLQDELDDRPTTADVNSLLATKADTGGTPDTSFVLNQDQVGVPGSNVELVVERGSSSNVGIRWNETSEEWEFTNDGVTYDAIGISSGSFYTQAQLNGGQLDSRYYTKSQLDAGQLNTLYYTETEADALFALIGHTHVAADITNFAAAVSANAPVQTVAGKVGNVLLTAADISGLDTSLGYPKVIGAIPGNLPAFGTTGSPIDELVDSGFSPTDFAFSGHTHTSGDITNFNTAVDARIAAASIDDLSDVVSVGPTDGDVLVFETAGGDYVNRALVLDELGDVVESSPAIRDALLYNGAAYVNRAILKADVSDFVESDYVHTFLTAGSPIPSETIFGDKIFKGDVTIEGDDTFLLAEQVRIKDKFIDLNWGETGAGIGGVSAEDGGIRIKRGTEPDAIMFYEESSDQWMAGVVGNADVLITGTNFVAQPEYELQTAPASSPLQSIYVFGFSLPVPVSGQTSHQVFVNGIKQREGAAKQYEVSDHDPFTVVFTNGNEPPSGADVEVYGFGFIGPTV